MKKDTAERILKAALLVFTKQGWSGATTQEIAKTAGVNEVTLFRHFGNKAQLFKAVVNRAVVLQSNALQQSIDQELPLEKTMQLFAAALYKSLTMNKSLIRCMINEKTEWQRQATKYVRQAVEPVLEQFEDLLKKYQRQGQLAKHLDCEVIRELFSGIIFSLVIKPKIRPHGFGSEEYLATAVELFVKGVKP